MLDIEVDTSLTGDRAIRVVERIAGRRGMSDDDMETSLAFHLGQFGAVSLDLF